MLFQIQYSDGLRSGVYDDLDVAMTQAVHDRIANGKEPFAIVSEEGAVFRSDSDIAAAVTAALEAAAAARAGGGD